MPRQPVDQPTYSIVRVASRKNFSIQWWDGKSARRRSTGTSDEKAAHRCLTDFTAKMSRQPRSEAKNPSLGEIIDGYSAIAKKRGVADTSDYVCKAQEAFGLHLY